MKDSRFWIRQHLSPKYRGNASKYFKKICVAVQYAHQHLVVHRDIKPSNILVSKDGEPKLLDFGISKLLSNEGGNTTTLTEFQALTPGYASPEQLSGRAVSTATDVYSLGVVLYQFLTGKLPYETESKSFSEIIKAITESEPIRPSLALASTADKNNETTINSKSLHGDLDNIILTALRKEPERRYSSVEEFNTDISKYLNDLPVTARANTFYYRASKFFLRNKTATITAVFLILSLIAGIFATTWQAVVAGRERNLAEKRFQDVRQLSTSLLFEITPKIERLEGSTEAREILVKRALEYLDSLAADANDPELQSELASAYEKVGDVKGNPDNPNLGDLQGGRESYEKAHKIRLALAAYNPADFEIQRLLAANYNAIGDFNWWSSNIAGATESYEKALEIFTQLAEQEPANAQIQTSLINSTTNKIKVISYNGHYQESVTESQNLLRKIEALEPNFPADKELTRLKGLCLIRIAYDLSWQNRYDILDEYVIKSIEVSEKLFNENKSDTKISRFMYYVYFQAGEIYVDQNDALSGQYLKKSLAIAQQTVAGDPLNLRAQSDLALTYSKLGEVLTFLKKPKESLEFLLEGKKIFEKLLSKEEKHDGYRFSLAVNYSRISTVQEEIRDFPNAIKFAENANEQFQTLSEADADNNMCIRAMAVVNQDLGRIYEKLKQNKNALVNYRKSVELFNLLKQKNAMGDYDNKTLETSEKAIIRLQK